MTNLWINPHGRELDSTPMLNLARGSRIVACLNVWNDLPALQETMKYWLPYVARVIVVDGAYEHTGHALSTDGTREFLQKMRNVTIIDGAGLSQCEKRTRYLRAGEDGDMLFIIDADEAVLNAETLRCVPECDVGWIRMKSSLYQRTYGQPRLIKWRPNLEYRGRHHWMYEGDRLLCTHQYGGSGYSHRPVNLLCENRRHLGRSNGRLAVKHDHQARQLKIERVQSAIPQSIMSDAAIGARESLQIMMHAYRDDGLAPSRLHTAINRTTPHNSVFFKARPGPFDVPEQYLTARHHSQLRIAKTTADIVHFHGTMSSAGPMMGSARMPAVFHQHGTLFRQNAEQYVADAKKRNALMLLSNLELLSWSDGIDAFFLPNAMPVARYRHLAAQKMKDDTVFRVAHSPSHPQKKGTDAFIAVCNHLETLGYPIQPVILHGLSHREVLHQKATCHAAFDSFWLGIQCSGLESAAMGLPVIAGDETVAGRYRLYFGEVPYTFANDAEQLESALIRLMDDREFYAAEALRVSTYATEHHDESAVALKYLDLLDAKFGWRSNLLTSGRRLAQRQVGAR